MNKKQLEALMTLFAPEIEALGYELIDVDWEREGNDHLLVFYIYHPDGINIEDCQIVDTYLNPRLDEIDPIKGPYSLSVSSPDLSRPLKSRRDLERNLGQMIEIKFFGAKDGKKVWTGTLVAFDDDQITLRVQEKKEDKEHILERKEIASIRPAIIF